MSYGGRFDTHEAVKYFIEAGFSERQAEAVTRKIIEVVGYNAATKQDVDQACGALDKKIEDVRLSITDVRRDMRELEMRMTIKLGALIVGGVGFLAAIKFFG
jgi:hypothetical protein